MGLFHFWKISNMNLGLIQPGNFIVIEGWRNCVIWITEDFPVEELKSVLTNQKIKIFWIREATPEEKEYCFFVYNQMPKSVGADLEGLPTWKQFQHPVT